MNTFFRKILDLASYALHATAVSQGNGGPFSGNALPAPAPQQPDAVPMEAIVIPDGPGTGVFVNGVPLTGGEVAGLAPYLGSRPNPGRYWYDPVSGWAGSEGQPTAVVLPPRMKLGGPLQATASAGTTGIFINGRELPQAEAAYLAMLTNSPVLPGRYWVDAQGNAGFEGRPALVNLYALAQASSRSGASSGGDWTWQGKGTGMSASGDGGRNIAVFWEGGSYSQGD
jgi:hypothetical protein